MSSSVRHSTNTQSVPAYQPEHDGIRRGWLFVVAALFALALIAIMLRPVCWPDTAGANETGFGVRHQQRGAGWIHCEPWIRRALTH